MFRSERAVRPVPDGGAGERSPTGEFPFRIADGAEESRYLTWLRNHSSYMAVRGLLDYFRAVSVLVRGAFVNLLVGLPYLLVLATAVAVIRVSLPLPPFYFAARLLVLAAVMFGLFPIRTFLTKIRRFRRSAETGAESSVKERDAWERSVGRLLATIAIVAALEALPLLVDPFHAWAEANSFGASQLASVTGVVLTAFSFADKLLGMLPGKVAKAVAGLAIGALGLIVPLLIVLFVADFLVFSPPPAGGDLWMTATAWSLPVLLVIGLVIGAASRAFSSRDALIVILTLVGSVLMARLTFISSDAYVDHFGAERTALELEQASATDEELRKRGEELRTLTAKLAAEPGPYLKDLLEHIDSARGPSQELEAEALAIRPGAEQLEQDLRYLEHAAVGYGVERLVESVNAVRAHAQGKLSGAELTELEQAVAQLRKRIAVLGGLFARQGPALVSHILEHDAAELKLLRGAAPAAELVALPSYRDASHACLSPICGEHYYGVVLHLMEWGEMLAAARREVAATVVYEQQYPMLYELASGARETALRAKSTLLLTLALLLFGFCWLTVDVNLTSIHGLYRDRLASAFLVGLDSKGDVDIEDDLDLGDLCRHEAGSTAPYHLINVALNLQGSSDIGLRDRRSDFFIFSKLFIGGRRTGYCRSETMERVFPQMSLATAMAISAAAASPNMGRATSPALVALMTLLNIRLGIWVPNPGVLADKLDGASNDPKSKAHRRGLSFEQVFAGEIQQVQRRWQQLGAHDRQLASERTPTAQHGLVGLAFSGGGIRSATVNLGIAQALDYRGVFRHFDYMSTVSGGGYLGSSISALMRSRTRTVAEVAGRVSIRDEGDQTVVSIAPEQLAPREYRYAKGAPLAVENGALVQAGQRLLATNRVRPGSFGEQFRWQVPPKALLWEMRGALDENKRWVNVSDGGHIENLATIELLRRRCKYIVIGDAEADPDHRFTGLSTLIRTARIDLGIDIDIDVDALRLGEGGRTKAHWAIGRVRYPDDAELGYLLYLKSSICGHEDEVIREYRHGHPDFPHESTADQMFDEGQFEAYRSLGQHIGEAALEHLSSALPEGKPASYADLERWFDALVAARAGDAGENERAVVESGPAPRKEAV